MASGAKQASGQMVRDAVHSSRDHTFKKSLLQEFLRQGFRQVSGGHPLTAAHPTRRMATPQPGAAVPAAPRARALDRLLSCPVAGARAGAPPRAGVRRARRRGAPRARLSGCHAPAPRQARGWPRGQRGRKPACAALPSPVGARQRWCGGPGAGRATCARAWAEPGGVRASRSRLAPHALFWQVGKPLEPRVPHGRRCATPRT